MKYMGKIPSIWEAFLTGYAIETSYSSMFGGEYHSWWLDDKGKVRINSTNKDLMKIIPKDLTLNQVVRIFKSLYRKSRKSYREPLDSQKFDQKHKFHELCLIEGIGPIIK